MELSKKLIRLDRLLSNLGYCSRSEVKNLIKAGVVRCLENTPLKPNNLVDHSLITYDQQKLDPLTIRILFHKPAGFVCSHNENEGRLIYELLPPRWQKRNPKVNTIGRLDKDTTGLVIITDDGDLNHKLSQPNKISKTYLVETKSDIPLHTVNLFGSGTFCLNDDPNPLLPAELKILGSTLCQLKIYEGRYHQIKRMFASIGNQVVRLHRQSIGNLSVDCIPESCWIELTDDMISQLKA